MENIKNYYIGSGGEFSGGKFSRGGGGGNPGGESSWRGIFLEGKFSGRTFSKGGIFRGVGFSMGGYKPSFFGETQRISYEKTKKD